MKYSALLLLLGTFSAAVSAEMLSPYNGKECQYQGEVGKSGLPEGKGTWSCRNGNRYDGAFKDGKFDGQGKYSVGSQGNIFLEPFGVYSAYFKNMTVEGNFKNNRANGKHRVSENGQLIFTVTFDKGIMKDVKLVKTKK